MRPQIDLSHLDDADGYRFFPDRAERAIRFIEKYAAPPVMGRTIKLLPWQRQFVSYLYGYWSEDGTSRRFKRAVVSTAKKNGKTVLQAGILLYELFGDICPAPLCISASTSRKNASQIYRVLAASCKKNPRLARIAACRQSTKEIRYIARDGLYISASADAGTVEGENISACVIDEYHHHKSDALFRSLEFSTIDRPTGYLAVVSTAGDDLSSNWHDLFTYARNVQDGTIKDSRFLPMIFTTPLDADIDDPKSWYQSNPTLGVNVKEADFKKELLTATQQGTASLLSFRRYRLNQFVQPDDAFVSGEDYDACRSVRPSEAELKSAALYVGCDLSQTTDMCSVYCCFALSDRRFWVEGMSWVCEAGVRKREATNMPGYRQYEADNLLTITKGTANDYRQIRKYISDLRDRYKLKEVIFDQYNALEMAAELSSEGLTVFRHPQNHRHFNGPIREFEIALKERRLLHGGNRLLKWALLNARLDLDSYGNAKLSKDKSTDKIDPAIATLMAVGRAVAANATTGKRRSVYDDPNYQMFL